MVACDLPKVETRVRFSLPAQNQKAPVELFDAGKQANLFACVRESETLSISFEIFNFKRCEECTDPVRIDKCTHVLYTRTKSKSSCGAF